MTTLKVYFPVFDEFIPIQIEPLQPFDEPYKPENKGVFKVSVIDKRISSVVNNKLLVQINHKNSSAWEYINHETKNDLWQRDIEKIFLPIMNAIYSWRYPIGKF